MLRAFRCLTALRRLWCAGQLLLAVFEFVEVFNVLEVYDWFVEVGFDCFDGVRCLQGLRCMGLEAMCLRVTGVEVIGRFCWC